MLIHAYLTLTSHNTSPERPVFLYILYIEIYVNKHAVAANTFFDSVWTSFQTLSIHRPLHSSAGVSSIVCVCVEGVPTKIRHTDAPAHAHTHSRRPRQVSVPFRGNQTKKGDRARYLPCSQPLLSVKSTLNRATDPKGRNVIPTNSMSAATMWEKCNVTPGVSVT